MRRILVGTVVSGLLVTSISIGAALASDGDLDTDFPGGGAIEESIQGTDRATAVAVQPDGKILVVGRTQASSDYDFAIVRYLPSGTKDPSFGGGSPVVTSISTSGPGHDYPTAMAVQSDGKIVVVGYSSGASDNDVSVVRYNSDGTLDTGFDGDGKLITHFGSGVEQAYDVAIQPDGNILVVGGVGPNENAFDTGIMRLMPTGALDTTFGPGGIKLLTLGSGGDSARSVALQRDGKIMIGARSLLGSAVAFTLVRLSSTGSLDSDFGTAGVVTGNLTPGDDLLSDIALQPDGKIVAAGSSDSNADGKHDGSVARFTADGQLDGDFGVGGAVLTSLTNDSPGEKLYALALQTDGKIVVAGDVNETDVLMIRYDPSGALDASFGGDGIVTYDPNYTIADDVAIQPDNKIVAAGMTSSFGNDDFLVLRYAAISTAAELSGLTVSSGTVSPTFSRTTTAYSVSVPNSMKSFSVTPTAVDRNSVITVNGTTTATGSSSAAIPLSIGVNTITVALTAQDTTTTKTYTITVTRLNATLKVKKSMTAKAALISVDKTVPRGAKVKITVAKSSKKVCSTSAGKIRGLKKGTCRVTIAVTPKPTKAVKKPATTRTSVTITVN